MFEKLLFSIFRYSENYVLTTCYYKTDMSDLLLSKTSVEHTIYDTKLLVFKNIESIVAELNEQKSIKFPLNHVQNTNKWKRSTLTDCTT